MRYEISTRVVRSDGLIRMMETLLHRGWAPTRDEGAGARIRAKMG